MMKKLTWYAAGDFFLVKAAGKTVAWVILLFWVLNGSAQSPYTVRVDIPSYDPNNREHFLIESKDDWAHINDAGKRFFYVKPNADYGVITISAQGTAESMRYISLYNGNDLHPAMLERSEQANVEFVFNGARYWIVDRMSQLDHGDANHFCIEIKGGSQHIVLNRFYFSNFYAGIIVRGTDEEPFTSDITIQNSRFDPMSPKGIDGDALAILLMRHTWNTPGRVLNTRILNNEMRNCNDGVMLIRMPQFEGNGTYWVDYPGTVIDYNHIYSDTAVYTDGNGNHDPNGKWALTENAVDLKCGSDDPENPVVVSNNFFWGYRRTDQNGGGSGSWGTALAAHYYVKNLVIKNNVIFNSNRGIVSADPSGLDYSAENVEVSGNILYNNGHPTSGERGIDLLLSETKDITLERNTLVAINKQSHWVEEDASNINLEISCNVIIDSDTEVGSRSSSTSVHDNTYYDTPLRKSGDGTFFPGVPDAHMADLTFTTDNYTNNRRDITLYGVITTSSSPHAKGCFSFTTPGKAGNSFPPLKSITTGLHSGISGIVSNE